MTGKERMNLAMSLKEPDRVPVMCQMSWGHILLNSGLKPSDFLFNPRYFAEGFLIMREKYQFDGILINQYPNLPEEIRSALRIETTEHGEMCHYPNGDRVFCPSDDDPRELAPKIYPEIGDIEIDKVEIMKEIPDWKVEAHRIVVEKAGREYSIHGEVSSPYTKARHLLGIENALIGLIEDPEKMEQLIDKYVTESFAFAKAQIEAGVDAVKISSAYAGGSFISLAFYQRFVLPYEKKLIRQIKGFKSGIPVYIHTCGLIGDRLELMAETGIDGIECLDPAPLGNCELGDAKQRIGKTKFIKGNMDSVNALLNSTPESIEEYVKKQIRIGAPGGGYILSSACSVSPYVKPEIMKMLVPLAEKYGTYPLK